MQARKPGDRTPTADRFVRRPDPAPGPFVGATTLTSGPTIGRAPILGLAVALLLACACSGRSLGTGQDSGTSPPDASPLADDGAVPVDARPPGCGNGLREPDEACDGSDLGPETCLGLTGLPEGDLACLPDCTYDASGCFGCGDGIVQGGEACDGTALAPGIATCEDLGLAGLPTCAPDCQSVDHATCLPCGNGLCEVDLGESAQVCPSDCGWTLIALSDYGATIGVRRDGTLWQWGITFSIHSSTPTLIRGIDQVTRAAFTGYHWCAVRIDGAVWCWGSNSHGAIGAGPMQQSPNGPYTDVPVAVPGVSDASDITASETHTCALTRSGDVLCWGANDFGQLGLGTTDGPDFCTWGVPCSPLPVQVPGLPPVATISAARRPWGATCAATIGGDVYCWGDNRTGQLGGIPGGEGCSPDQPCPRAPVLLDWLSAVTAVACGGTSCCVIANGTPRCWDPDYQSLLAVDSVSFGGGHLCVISDYFGTYCRGYNYDGQLGNGSYDSSEDLVPVLSPVAFRSVHLDSFTSCAIDWNHVAWCWGDNFLGQCGFGPNNYQVDSSVPQQVVN